MAATSGNCLKGNRKLIYENIAHDAIENGPLNVDPHGIHSFWGRLLRCTETQGEKQMRVRAEWERNLLEIRSSMGKSAP